MVKSKRLGPDDWLDAGKNALVLDGPAALKAEPLARRLGTTKGSFYWHFKDVPTYHAALLRQWEAGSYGAIVSELQNEHTATVRLRRLPAVIPSDWRTAESAIRAWAAGHPVAAEAAARIDDQRMTYIQSLLSEIDIPNPDMPRLLYSTLLGLVQLGQDNIESAMEGLADLVLALR